PRRPLAGAAAEQQPPHQPNEELAPRPAGAACVETDPIEGRRLVDRADREAPPQELRERLARHDLARRRLSHQRLELGPHRVPPRPLRSPAMPVDGPSPPSSPLPARTP